MPRAPWKQARGLDTVEERWLASGKVKPCLYADVTQPARAPRFAEEAPCVDPRVWAALRETGVDRLYAHQARAIDAAVSGRSVCISTPTASGKSACFHLPVLDALARDPSARAIYLFPTKALSRDQEASLRAMLAHTRGANDASALASAIVYDGDTPADARRAARERGGIILTNPDMLHAGILPQHPSWARTFAALKYVVVDELHTYRGVFGSHVANVLRRLRRIARFHGSNPVFLGATATIGNPHAHAARLFGMPTDAIELVDESGAPSGERRVFVYNPPVVNAELGVRASYIKRAVSLAADLIRAHVPTIVFGSSRNNVEIMLRYLRDAISRDLDPRCVAAYRGGYLPAERRDIERRLRTGDLLGVVATNALELGIDIGDLSAVVCAGYPGSVAATWQRFGRAGRRRDKSIAVLVTSSAPLDQYVAREPDFILGAPVEEARIDPDNVEIVVQHLKCAAFELPFREGDAFGDLDASETTEALDYLASHGVVHRSGATYHWSTDTFPANNISLRTIGWDNVVIIDVETEASIAELDWRGSHTMLHEQAIYQHDGSTYQVERFDYENHKAFVRRVEPDYFTDAQTHVRVSVIEVAEADALDGARDTRPGDAVWETGHGDVSVIEKVVGYKKVKFFTHENAGYGEVMLPEMQMHTTAFWLVVPESVVARFETGRAAVVDGLRGIGRALETATTLSMMCDPKDLGVCIGDATLDTSGEVWLPEKGGSPTSETEAVYRPALFVYEHVPGGVGVTARLFESRAALLLRAKQLIGGCECEFGCPACVGPHDATDPAVALASSRKRAALSLLDDALGLRLIPTDRAAG